MASHQTSKQEFSSPRQLSETIQEREQLTSKDKLFVCKDKDKLFVFIQLIKYMYMKFCQKLQ